MQADHRRPTPDDERAFEPSTAPPAACRDGRAIGQGFTDPVSMGRSVIEDGFDPAAQPLCRFGLRGPDRLENVEYKSDINRAGRELA
jgi:hypothetical protein